MSKPERRRYEKLSWAKDTCLLQAGWIYLTADVTAVHFGGVSRTLKAGWHNIAWR